MKPQHPNLTKHEEEGMKSLKEKKYIVVFQTDKSGRFATDSKQNYIEACDPHTNNDQVISEDEHVRCQKAINAHAVMWTKMLKMGENEKGNAENRIKGNVTVATGSHGTASLYTLRKDHKSTSDQEKGPPVRPVCSGNEGYNNKLSHIVSKILRPIWKESETCCENTEEILADIKEVNEQEIEGDICVGSLDVKALYPSLDIDFTSEVVAQEFYESTYEVEGVNAEELGLYLSLVMSEEEQVAKGIQRYCYQRKTKTGRKPLITGQATTSNNNDVRFKPWKPPESIPNRDEVKKMLAEALRITIQFIMKNHIYSFNNTLRKQTCGGPIGLELTGDLAQIFMHWWDKQMKMKMTQENITVLIYKRYVDDINIAALTNADQQARETEETSVKEIDREEEQPESAEDKSKEGEKMLMNKIKQIGNSIHQSIQLEMDCPALHDDRKLPMLDIKIWTEREKEDGYQEEGENQRDEETNDDEETTLKKSYDTIKGESNKKRNRMKILHEFYMKDVASKSTVHARSAMSWKDKRTIITQEILRILLRCSPDLPWKQTIMHIEKYMERLQFSGYSKRFRKEVWRSAMKAYREIRKKDARKEKPIYRKKTWRRNEREKDKRTKKTGWYKKGGFKSIIFVPATPGSVLKRRYDNILKESKLNIKAVERSGTKLKKLNIKE